MNCENPIPPKYENWKRQNYRSESMSPLALWYQQENGKRQQGLLNEIDINEIRAALKGTINKWTATIKNHRDEVQAMVDTGKYDWNRLQEIKNN